LLNQVVGWRGRLVYLTASHQVKKKPKKST